MKDESYETDDEAAIREILQSYFYISAKFGASDKIAKTVLTEEKYGARLAINKGKGALRMILRAPFLLYGIISIDIIPAPSEASVHREAYHV